MSCPTCDHTMQRLGESGLCSLFNCPRCGTIKSVHSVDSREEVYVPALVERCRDFADQAVNRKTERIADVWRRTGIAEAINKPEGRPQ